MYAYTIYPSSWYNLVEGRDEVNWCPVDESFNTPENLRDWVKKVIG